MKGTVLVMVGPEYEDLEVWYPKLRMDEAGWRVRLAGLDENLPIFGAAIVEFLEQNHPKK